jgi:hypothetical protein
MLEKLTATHLNTSYYWSLRRLLIVLTIAPLIQSCVRNKQETSKLTIQLPAIQTLSSKSNAVQSVTATSDGSPWSGSSSALSEINCYVVMVGGPTGDLQKNTCSKRSSQDVALTFGPMIGGVQAGKSISIEVPSGPDRKIYLLGTKSATGGCVDFLKDQVPSGLNSYPRILTTSIQDLQPGTKSIVLTLPSEISTLTEIDKCSFASGSGGDSGGGGGGGGNNGPQFSFGDGRDGDVLATAAGVDFSTATHSHGSLTFSNTTMSSAKMLSAARKINNIATDGTTVTVATSFSADEFQIGDEVMWIVNAAYHNTAPDSACGGGLYRGAWGTAKVVGTPSSTMMVLDTPISTTANNAALSETNYSASGNTHCKMQVVRVPNFKVLTLTGTSDLYTGSYSLSSATGGVLVVRAEEIVVGTVSASTSSFHANGKGFSSVIYKSGSGDTGEFPTAAVSSANSTGGAYGGGGGSHAGSGGMGNTYPSGNPITYCIGSTPCQTYRDKKAFFGGAGGGSSSTAGGSGGGIVMVFAKKISGHASSTLSIQAEASASGWGQPNNGGGAGGSVFLASKQINLSGSQLTLKANGESRNENSSATGSGGGGGGAVEVLFCQSASNVSASTLTANTYVSGGAVWSSASPGNAGEKLVTDSSMLCSLP